jgi:hypothetical protein
VALIEEALATHLAAHTGIAALVATRVYPQHLPQNPTLPAVSYQVVGGGSDYQHGGASGRARPFFQIDAWAATYATAKILAEEIKKAMIAFVGTFSGVKVDGAYGGRTMDFYEESTRIHRVSRDFEVFHSEAVA